MINQAEEKRKKEGDERRKAEEEEDDARDSQNEKWECAASAREKINKNKSN